MLSIDQFLADAQKQASAQMSPIEAAVTMALTREVLQRSQDTVTLLLMQEGESIHDLSDEERVIFWSGVTAGLNTLLEMLKQYDAVSDEAMGSMMVSLVNKHRS